MKSIAIAAKANNIIVYWYGEPQHFLAFIGDIPEKHRLMFHQLIRVEQLEGWRDKTIIVYSLDKLFPPWVADGLARCYNCNIIKVQSYLKDTEFFFI